MGKIRIHPDVTQNTLGNGSADVGRAPAITMTEPQKEPEPKEGKKPKALRDLKPEKEVTGGTRNGGGGEKRPTRKTGEIDFMNWE